MYNPIDVVDKFIELANSQGKVLTHMQAQKLLYIAHGFNLAFYNEPLLSEPVFAWQYGPVIPSVYHVLKDNRSEPIRNTVNRGGAPCVLDPKTDALLKMIYDTYGSLSGIQLSEFTHRTGTPWSMAVKEHRNTISDDAIRDYYIRLTQRDPHCIGL